MHENFKAMYPKSVALGLRPVGNDQISHPGFDERDVDLALGVRYDAFTAGVKEVFVCAHDNYADGPRKGTEVHCYYAADVEKFLEGK